MLQGKVKMNKKKNIDQVSKTNKLKVVGTNPMKIDGIEKVTGAAVYTGDIYLPGMLHGKIKRSPYAHARVKSISTDKALALEGVKAVLTYEDVPKVKHKGSPAPRAGGLIADQLVLTGKPLCVGDGIAAVAAISEEVAEQALELIEVEYEVLPPILDPKDALKADALILHDGNKNNHVFDPISIEHGDIKKGFDEADHIFETTYNTGRPHPAYLEPNICVCSFDRSGKLTVWASTQGAFMVRGTLSEVLDIPVSDIQVIIKHLGGSFGSKQDLYQHEYVCTLLAKKTKRPVRMEYTREESMTVTGTRHPVEIKIKQGVKNDGTLTARQVEYTADSGAYASHASGITWVGCEGLSTLYRCQDNVEVKGQAIYTNNPIAGGFRGFGAVQGYYALDCHMDEIARQLEIDPVDFRIQNAVREGDNGMAYGVPVKGEGLAACLEKGAEATGWYQRKDQAPPKNPNIKSGWGVGSEMHTCGAYPSINEQSNAILKINEDGTIHLLTGVADLGTGTQTVLAQIVAEELGLPLSSIRVTTGDTDIVPFDIGAYASRSVFVAGKAAQMAACKLRDQIIELAAERLETSIEKLIYKDGIVQLKSTPNTLLTLQEVVQGKDGLSPRSLVSHACNEPKVGYSYGVHFAEVEVNTLTGKIEVKNVTAVHEIGKVIYPKGAEGQIEGCIQQGVGHTLTEEILVDKETGRVLNPNYVGYKMPLSVDMPEINTIILEEVPDDDGAFGAKGLAEDPIMAIGPAIANAVYDAIGIRFRQYPITPEMVLQSLDKK